MATKIDKVADLPSKVGQHLGYSEWTTIDQKRVNLFADATGDHQWIHVDPERAKKESPFGGPIAHGYLTLSLVPLLLPEVVVVGDAAMALNYGAEKVRFPSPVPVGSEVRMGVELAGVDKAKDGSSQCKLVCTFEVKGAGKPSCVAEVLFRFYGG